MANYDISEQYPNRYDDWMEDVVDQSITQIYGETSRLRIYVAKLAELGDAESLLNLPKFFDSPPPEPLAGLIVDGEPAGPQVPVSTMPKHKEVKAVTQLARTAWKKRKLQPRK